MVIVSPIRAKSSGIRECKSSYKRQHLWWGQWRQAYLLGVSQRECCETRRHPWEKEVSSVSQRGQVCILGLWRQVTLHLWQGIIVSIPELSIITAQAALTSSQVYAAAEGKAARGDKRGRLRALGVSQRGQVCTLGELGRQVV